MVSINELNDELKNDAIQSVIDQGKYILTWSGYHGLPNTIDVRGEWVAIAKDSGQAIQKFTGVATIYCIDDWFHRQHDQFLAEARTKRNRALTDLLDVLRDGPVTDAEIDAAARAALLVMLEDRSAMRNQNTQLAAIELATRLVKINEVNSATPAV